MNDFEKPPGNHFEISREELGMLFATLAYKLVSKGEFHPTEDAIVRDNETTPFSFGYTIPNLVAKQIFYPGDTEIALVKAHIQYDQPHRIDESPNDQLVQSVYISMRSRLIDTDIFINQFIRLSQDNKFHPYISGTVDVEYSNMDGKSLSYPVPGRTGTAEEIIAHMLNARLEGERSLLIDDVEKLRQLIDHLS